MSERRVDCGLSNMMMAESSAPNSSPSSAALPPAGCTNGDLLRLIDLCPFLASDKIKYDDAAVLNLLQKNPGAACLRAPFHRFGIGRDLHPLALVVALGGSLEVVRIMVEACPEALSGRLSGRRSLLHYAISEGVNAQVIRYLLTRYPDYLSETDSYNAIPLHLASAYPSSSLSVLQLLLHLHPDGAKSIDNQSQTPLHRACKSRASLEKVMALVEVCPDVLCWRDWCGNTPLVLADRMDHRLGDVRPEVVELLELTEEVLRLGSKPAEAENNDDETRNTVDERKQRAQEILMRFRSIGWQAGIAMALSHNIHLFSLLSIPTSVMPELLSLIGSGTSAAVTSEPTHMASTSKTNSMNRLHGLYSLLRHHPLENNT